MAKRLRYNTQAMKRKDQITVVCPYNDAVDCNMRDFGDEWYCFNCGWNPKKSRNRSESSRIRPSMLKITIIYTGSFLSLT